jgi:RimJ/RimL family protein N-acetyltransferase
MIKGKVCGLRAIQHSDLDTLLKWRNSPEVRCFFRETREISPEQQSAWFENIVNKDPRTNMFSIVRLEDNELLGACGLCYIDQINQNADFSIYIGKDNLYIDEVYAVDAAQLLLSYGFDELNLHRIWAEIYSIDEPKIQFFDTLNFVVEGIHRETHWTKGKWVNSLFYGMLQKDYLNQSDDG